MYGIERPEPTRAEPRPKSSRNPGFSGLAVQIGNAPFAEGDVNRRRLIVIFRWERIDEDVTFRNRLLDSPVAEDHVLRRDDC